MTGEPPLPNGYELPVEVNGWVHAPDSNLNAYVWNSADDTAQLRVSGFGGRIMVRIYDARVEGFARSRQLYTVGYDNTDEYFDPPEPTPQASPAVVNAIEIAARWMGQHPNWNHPDIPTEAFDPPAGFSLAQYHLEEREHIIYYEQDTQRSALEMCGQGAGTAPSLTTRKYICIESWRGSGNTTISLAPWVNAHDHEKHEIVDPPEGCGLDIALKLTRDWIQDQSDTSQEQPATGQTDISAWVN